MTPQRRHRDVLGDATLAEAGAANQAAIEACDVARASIRTEAGC